MMTNERLEEQKLTATTIIQQMGGFGKLKAMVNARDFCALKAGVKFRFTGSRMSNICIVNLDEALDLYDFELWRVGTRKGQIYSKLVHTETGLYFDMLKPTFEEETGLRLSL